MGTSRFSATDWSNHVSASSTKTRAEIFTSSAMKDELNPAKFDVRESCDSDFNPASTPIMLACDVTGSMGYLAENVIRKGMGVIMKEIYDRKPVPDPHLLVMATGDMETDKAPIQATQFEADIVLAEQMKDIYIEGNGGGNGGETYNGAWLLASRKTKCDHITKGRGKGYLFTIGDECPLDTITKEQAKTFLGLDIEADIKIEDLLAEVQQNWEVFHLIVMPVSYQPVVKRWTELLGDRAITVQHADLLSEVIVSTLQVLAGEDIDKVVDSWDGSTGVVVREAVSGLVKKSDADESELVRA